MRRFICMFVAVATLMACEKEEEFACRLMELGAEQIGSTTATVYATVDATDYSQIGQMGFCIRRSGSESYEWYTTKTARSISYTFEDLTPQTTYEYAVFVMAVGDSWMLPSHKFITLAASEEP